MMIKFDEVSFKYPNFKMENLSFEIQKGEIVALTGNNASGKSTLLNLILGIIKPKKGLILIDDSIRKNSNIKIGAVFQNPDNQIIHNNVFDDICFTLKNYEIPKEEWNLRIDEALDLVGMTNYKNAEIFSLSTGQKQKIAIANMLSIKPDIMLFDEASVYLDPCSKENFYQILQKLKEQQITVVFSTNSIDEIVYSDKTMILKNGKIVDFLDTNELVKNLNIFRDEKIKIPLKLEIIEKFSLDKDVSNEEILKNLEKKS